MPNNKHLQQLHPIWTTELTLRVWICKSWWLKIWRSFFEIGMDYIHFGLNGIFARAKHSPIVVDTFRNDDVSRILTSHAISTTFPVLELKLKHIYIYIIFVLFRFSNGCYFTVAFYEFYLGRKFWSAYKNAHCKNVFQRKTCHSVWQSSYMIS